MIVRGFAQRFFSVALAALVLSACAMEDIEIAPEVTWPSEGERTENRSITGEILYPKWLLQLPEHYEFLPRRSNFDNKHDHPAQWEGQDWDPEMWGDGQTPELVLRRLYSVRVFNAQYSEEGVPVLELGPKFWKLSDLDRRRGIKLLADHTHVLEQGHERIVLRDWYTKDNIGIYNAKGMFLK